MSGRDSDILLLHVCCAPCASACVERLLAEGRKIRLFFSNSNLCSEAEYSRRRESVRRLASVTRTELVEDPYDHASWHAALSASLPGYARYPEGTERCRFCFSFSLGRAAEHARQNGMSFTTSLTVSPHKNSKLIFEVGSRWSFFEAVDFKKKDGFRRSIELSKQYGFYRQDFCGCEFSQKQRDVS